jgi:hypothetical protein
MNDRRYRWTGAGRPASSRPDPAAPRAETYQFGRDRARSGKVWYDWINRAEPNSRAARVLADRSR